MPDEEQQPVEHQPSPNVEMGEAVDDIESIGDIVDEICDVAEDRRVSDRMPYDNLIGLVVYSATGIPGEPMVLQGVDISPTGISVISRRVLTPGIAGVLQMVRASGRVALIGGRVTSCGYGKDMTHRIGIEFTSLPKGVRPADFLDENKKLMLVDPLLSQNIQKAS